MDYRKTIKEIYEEYKVDPKLGLTSKQVKERIELYGQNILEKEKKKSLIKMFVEQFKDPMVVILIVGAVMSLVLGELIDASIILFVLILNAFIGVFQESKAEKSLRPCSSNFSIFTRLSRRASQLERLIIQPPAVVLLQNALHL